MNLLANGLSAADHDEDALGVREAELSTMRRLGASEHNMLISQGNLAITYEALGRLEPALEIKRDVYLGHLKLNGKEHHDTLREAENYALSLCKLQRFKEAKSLMRRSLPVARRVLGASNLTTIRMSRTYAKALCMADGATLDDLREAVTTLEDAEQTGRRVLGGANPITELIEFALRNARAALHAREAGKTVVFAEHT